MSRGTVLGARFSRIGLALIGIGLTGLLLRHTGTAAVWQAITRASIFFPVIVVLELTIVACELRSLRLLYGKAAARIPAGRLLRAGLVGYAVAGLTPIGRAVGEAAKARLLSRYVGGPEATAAAIMFEGVLLSANASISVACGIAALLLAPSYVLPGAIGINAVVTATLGLTLLLGGRNTRIGAWVGRRFPRAGKFGARMDARMHEPWPGITAAVAWAVGGRLIQVMQLSLLLVVLGGGTTVIRSLAAEGVNLVAGAVGDLIPSQIGAIEASFVGFALPLSLSKEDAVAIPLLVHLAQVFWIAIGSLVPLVWRAEPDGGSSGPGSGPLGASAP
jgi:hypothetical protein